jgi:low affinity Fe/Cu permease
MRPTKSSSWFTNFAKATSRASGRPSAFGLAVAIVVVWGVTGPLFGFSNTWQLVINTGTTIVTFLMVFLIQNTQNRDARAINLKLNELIHAIGTAKNQMIDIEHLSDAELDRIAERYKLTQSDVRAAKDSTPQ